MLLMLGFRVETFAPPAPTGFKMRHTHGIRKPESSSLFATCRICRKQYAPKLSSEDEGQDDMCMHHSGSLRGESPRKSNWEDEGSGGSAIDNSKLAFSYNCCGGDADSPGCVTGTHKSFDDP